MDHLLVVNLLITGLSILNKNSSLSTNNMPIYTTILKNIITIALVIIPLIKVLPSNPTAIIPQHPNTGFLIILKIPFIIISLSIYFLHIKKLINSEKAVVAAAALIPYLGIKIIFNTKLTIALVTPALRQIASLPEGKK